jgi:hypothetical protein
MGIAHAFGCDAGDRLRRGLVDQGGEERGQQVDLDALPVPAFVTVLNRSKDSDGCEEAGDDVDECDADLLCRPTGSPVMLIRPPTACTRSRTPGAARRRPARNR